MDNFSTKVLFDTLTAFLKLQIIAVKLKHETQPLNKDLFYLPKNWYFSCGICANFDNVIENDHYDFLDLRKKLFMNCKSGTGDPYFPVKHSGNIGYTGFPSHMWGNHPYADNRRKIIEECIEQLHTELHKRGHNVG